MNICAELRCDSFGDHATTVVVADVGGWVPAPRPPACQLLPIESASNSTVEVWH